MSLRDYFGLVLSTSSLCAMIWACTFDDERIMLADMLAMPGGRYKFLTILNLYIQIFYYFICIINFFFGTNTKQLKRTTKLQMIRDYLFASVAFPMASFVGLTFWGLYLVDRRLIFPEEIEQLFPPFLNHAMHTLPVVSIFIENIFHIHNYPPRIFSLLCILIITGGYTAWLHYLNYLHFLNSQVNLWVYPILNQLSTVYRMCFFLGSTILTIGLYFIGEIYTRVLTNLRMNRSKSD